MAEYTSRALDTCRGPSSWVKIQENSEGKAYIRPLAFA